MEPEEYEIPPVRYDYMFEDDDDVNFHPRDDDNKYIDIKIKMDVEANGNCNKIALNYKSIDEWIDYYEAISSMRKLTIDEWLHFEDTKSEYKKNQEWDNEISKKILLESERKQKEYELLELKIDRDLEEAETEMEFLITLDPDKFDFVQFHVQVTSVLKHRMKKKGESIEENEYFKFLWDIMQKRKKYLKFREFALGYGEKKEKRIYE